MNHRRFGLRIIWALAAFMMLAGMADCPHSSGSNGGGYSSGGSGY